VFFAVPQLFCFILAFLRSLLFGWSALRPICYATSVVVLLGVWDITTPGATAYPRSFPFFELPSASWPSLPRSFDLSRSLSLSLSLTFLSPRGLGLLSPGT
jgi:hypothetical protein